MKWNITLVGKAHDFTQVLRYHAELPRSKVSIAGYVSQFLNYFIDVHECRQDSSPIQSGNHCFVCTNLVVLGSSRLSDCSILGARSLLNKNFESPGPQRSRQAGRLEQLLLS